MRFTDLLLIMIAYLLSIFLFLNIVSSRDQKLENLELEIRNQELESLHVFCIEHLFADAMILEGKGYCRTLYFSPSDGVGGDVVVTEEYLREFDAENAPPSPEL